MSWWGACYHHVKGWSIEDVLERGRWERLRALVATFNLRCSKAHFTNAERHGAK